MINLYLHHNLLFPFHCILRISKPLTSLKFLRENNPPRQFDLRVKVQNLTYSRLSIFYTIN